MLAELAGSWITPRVDILGVGVSAIDMPDCAGADRPMDIERRSPVCMRHGSAWDHGVTARSETS